VIAPAPPLTSQRPQDAASGTPGGGVLRLPWWIRASSKLCTIVPRIDRRARINRDNPPPQAAREAKPRAASAPTHRHQGHAAPQVRQNGPHQLCRRPLGLAVDYRSDGPRLIARSGRGASRPGRAAWCGGGGWCGRDGSRARFPDFPGGSGLMGGSGGTPVHQKLPEARILPDLSGPRSRRGHRGRPRPPSRGPENRHRATPHPQERASWHLSSLRPFRPAPRSRPFARRHRCPWGLNHPPLTFPALFPPPRSPSWSHPQPKRPSCGPPPTAAIVGIGGDGDAGERRARQVR
jgi:hypothetical protein